MTELTHTNLLGRHVFRDVIDDIGLRIIDIAQKHDIEPASGPDQRLFTFVKAYDDKTGRFYNFFYNGNYHESGFNPENIKREFMRQMIEPLNDIITL